MHPEGFLHIIPVCEDPLPEAISFDETVCRFNAHNIPWNRSSSGYSSADRSALGHGGRDYP